MLLVKIFFLRLLWLADWEFIVYTILRGWVTTYHFINFNFCRKKIHMFCSPSPRRDILTPVYGRYYYCFYFVNSQLL